MNVTPKEILKSALWREIVEELSKRHYEAFLRADPVDVKTLQQVALKQSALSELLREIASRVETPSPNL